VALPPVIAVERWVPMQRMASATPRAPSSSTSTPDAVPSSEVRTSGGASRERTPAVQRRTYRPMADLGQYQYAVLIVRAWTKEGLAGQLREKLDPYPPESIVSFEAGVDFQWPWPARRNWALVVAKRQRSEA
jgi:hypothetical protein